MKHLNPHEARAWVDRFVTEVEQRHLELTELDRLAGDGDYGTNLRSAVLRASTILRQRRPNSVSAVFTAVSDGFLDTGGTSGPLFGMWFRKIAPAPADEPAKGVSVSELAASVSSAVEAIQRLGHAGVGDKTMVDALIPAASALNGAAQEDAGLHEALRRAATAAAEGAASTKRMLARRGRASYVGDHAVGVVDPGALTVAFFFRTAIP